MTTVIDFKMLISPFSRDKEVRGPATFIGPAREMNLENGRKLARLCDPEKGSEGQTEEVTGITEKETCFASRNSSDDSNVNDSLDLDCETASNRLEFDLRSHCLWEDGEAYEVSYILDSLTINIEELF